MFKIIGADGKEYGPVTAEQLKQWLAEGRVNPQTKVLPEGATEWRTLAEIPEFAAALPIRPPATPAMAAGVVTAADRVRGPAVGLIVTAVLGFVANVFGLILNLFAAGLGTAAARTNPEFERLFSMFSGTVGVVSSLVGIVVSALVLYGALKMKKLEKHGWAITASILALIPCTSPCCLAGIPIGIWALVVLSKPEVKQAFN